MKISVIFCAILVGYAFCDESESESEFESEFFMPDMIQSSDDESPEEHQEPPMPFGTEKLFNFTAEHDENEEESTAVPPTKPDSQDLPTLNVTCPINCTIEGQAMYKDDLDFVKYLSQLKMSIRFRDQFKPENLEKFCNMHDYVKSCVLACPDEKDKTLFMRSFAIESVCTDKRMLRSPAFNEVFNSKLDECTDKCSEFGNKIAQMNGEQMKPNSMEAIKTGCQYMLCFNNCEHETLSEAKAVGKENAKYFQKLVAQAIKFTRLSAEAEGENLELPKECLDVEELGQDSDAEEAGVGEN